MNLLVRRALFFVLLLAPGCARRTERPLPEAPAATTPLPQGVVASDGTRTLPLALLRARVFATARDESPCLSTTDLCPEPPMTLIQRAFNEQVDELTARSHAAHTGLMVK